MSKIPKDKLLFYVVASIALVAVFLVIIDVINRSVSSVKHLEEDYKERVEERKTEKKEDNPKKDLIIIPEPNDSDEEMNDNNLNKEVVAIPSRTVELEESNKAMRFFEIRAENDQFKPKEIMVYQNEIVNIQITAIDKDYDVLVPEFSMKLNISKGDSGNLEFQAQKIGEFSFHCPSCDKAEGLIKVYPK